MRLFVKLMLLVVVLALAGPFFIKGPDGAPLMTRQDVGRSIGAGISSIKHKWQGLRTRAARATGDDNAGKITVHKWQDPNTGEWHYSDEAPPVQDSQIIQVDPNVNVMDAVPITTVEIAKPTGAATATAPDATPQILPILPTPGNVKNSIKKTQDVRDQVEDHNENIQKIIDQD